MAKFWRYTMLLAICIGLTACPFTSSSDRQMQPGDGNWVLFIGVDTSGSYVRAPHYRNSLQFLAHYLYAHLHGLGGLRVPHAVFVGTIGGTRSNEPKTFYPMQIFQYKSIAEIEKQLLELFPTNRVDPHTDFNAFFEQIETLVRNRKLVMKPIDILMLTDAIPDAPKVHGKHDYRSIDLSSLENLSRTISVRALYTYADTAAGWQTEIPRRRVRIWTQDAAVMVKWNEKDILIPSKPFEEQDRFFDWVKSNVDFPIRVRRVN